MVPAFSPTIIPGPVHCSPTRSQIATMAATQKIQVPIASAGMRGRHLNLARIFLSTHTRLIESHLVLLYDSCQWKRPAPSRQQTTPLLLLLRYSNPSMRPSLTYTSERRPHNPLPFRIAGLEFVTWSSSSAPNNEARTHLTVRPFRISCSLIAVAFVILAHAKTIRFIINVHHFQMKCIGICPSDVSIFVYFHHDPPSPLLFSLHKYGFAYESVVISIGVGESSIHFDVGIILPRTSFDLTDVR